MLLKSVPIAHAAFVAVLALGGSAALAQGLPPSATDLLRQEQERLRQEQERARPLQGPSGVDLQTLSPPVPAGHAQGPCSQIHSVQWVGAERLDPIDKARLAKGYAGSCLSAFDIQRLLGEVTRHYIDRGFVTTRAYLPEQDLRSGGLRILVQEGRIERIEVRGDDAARINVDLALPAHPGDVLNIRDLEQAVDQLNAVQGNKVRLDLLAGSAPGQTVVVLHNAPSAPVGLFLAIDNMGSRNTGRESVSATVTAGSLFRLNETISATLRTTVPHSRKRSADSASLSYSLPLGYSTLSLHYAESEFSSGFMLQYPSGEVPAYVTGRAITYGLGWDHVLARDQKSIHKLGLSLGTVDTKSYFELPQSQVSQFLASNSRRTTSLTLGTSSMWMIPNGLFTVTPQVVWGVRDKSYLVGINRDLQGTADFTKYQLAMSLKKGFRLARQDLVWGSELRGQYSRDNLLASQQLLIGGPPSVRGYLDSSLSGDSGYVWRNDLSLKKQFLSGGEVINARFYVGYDMGRVSNRLATAFNGRLSGAVLGGGAQWRGYDLDVSWGLSLQRPSWMKREPQRVLLRLSYSY